MMNITIVRDNQRRKSIVTTLLATVVAASFLFIMASDYTTERLSLFILRNKNNININIKVAHDPSRHDPRKLAVLAKDPKSVRTKMKVEPVHLMYAADEDAIKGVEASIRSVLKHASEPVVIHFVGPAPLRSFPDIDFIPLNMISEDQLSQFENEALKSSVSIKKFGNLNSNANFVRFIIADLLPDVSKVMWLDADTIVRCDVVSMVRKALTTTEYVIAAVPRGGRPAGLSGSFKTDIQTSFNAGVFVADLNRWRDQDITNKIASWAQRNQKEKIYGLGSQPPMALTIGENFEQLPHSWNLDGLGWRRKVDANVVGRACVLHWTGTKKHWKEGGLHKDLVDK